MPATSVELRKINDTLNPLNVVCYFRSNPYDWTGKTPTIDMDDSTGTAVITGGTCTAHPTQTFTLDSTNDVLVANAHGVQNGDQIVLATSGSLGSTGVAIATRYIAREVTPNALKVAEFPNGPTIDITGAGTGVHTFYILGSVTRKFAAGDVDAAGRFKAWIIATSGAETQTFPDDDEGIVVDIRA